MKAVWGSFTLDLGESKKLGRDGAKAGGFARLRGLGAGGMAFKHIYSAYCALDHLSLARGKLYMISPCSSARLRLN